MAKQPQARELPGLISKRERQVLWALSHGRRRIDIAERLGISPSTVNGIIARASRKLNATNAVHTVAVAFRRGVVS